MPDPDSKFKPRSIAALDREQCPAGDACPHCKPVHIRATDKAPVEFWKYLATIAISFLVGLVPWILAHNQTLTRGEVSTMITNESPYRSDSKAIQDRLDLLQHAVERLSDKIDEQQRDISRLGVGTGIQIETQTKAAKAAK